MSIEDENVKKVYDTIAEEFDNTRYRPWTCVEEFLNKVPENSVIGDIGCGNGKNMLRVVKFQTENLIVFLTKRFKSFCNRIRLLKT